MIYRGHLFIINQANAWQDYDYAVAESVEQALATVIQDIEQRYTPTAAAELLGRLDGCDVYEIPPIVDLDVLTYKACTRALAHANVWWDEIHILVMRDFVDWATGRGLGDFVARGIVYVMQQGIDLGLPLLVKGLKNPA